MTPRARVRIAGRHRSVTVDAVIDTGFDGDISLPISIAVTLGMELVSELSFELADGTRTEELVFAGRAKLAGKTRVVDIILSKSDDVLIGTRLLEDCRLAIDFRTERVRINRKA
jgi:clan AA aspartic protease